jgi:hypothetical protein
MKTLLLFLLGTAAAHAAAIRASHDPVKDERPITEKEREHWAWKPLIDTSGRTLDSFFKPGPSASREALIRRIYFDLTGLPPTPSELSDTSELSVIVAKLLTSPRYGEHWAQWWLDLARYAETDGFEHDKDRTHAWKYRDWVITALNNDLPLDEFVRVQIAGDLLGEEMPTGFLFAGPDMPDINNQELRRHTVLNDITGTVGSVCLKKQTSLTTYYAHAFARSGI